MFSKVHLIEIAEKATHDLPHARPFKKETPAKKNICANCQFQSKPINPRQDNEPARGAQLNANTAKGHVIGKHPD